MGHHIGLFYREGKKSHVDSTFGDSTTICFPFNFQTLQHWCRQRPPGHHSIWKWNPLHTSYSGFELKFFWKQVFIFLWSTDSPLMLWLSLCKTNNLFFWERLIFHTKVFQSALIGILNTLHFWIARPVTNILYRTCKKIVWPWIWWK